MTRDTTEQDRVNQARRLADLEDTKVYEHTTAQRKYWGMGAWGPKSVQRPITIRCEDTDGTVHFEYEATREVSVVAVRKDTFYHQGESTLEKTVVTRWGAAPALKSKSYVFGNAPEPETKYGELYHPRIEPDIKTTPVQRPAPSRRQKPLKGAAVATALAAASTLINDSGTSDLVFGLFAGGAIAGTTLYGTALAKDLLTAPAKAWRAYQEEVR